MNVSPRENPRLGLRLIGLMLVVSAIVIAVCWALYLREVDRIEVRMREREVVRVESLAYFLRTDLKPVVDDLLTLATGDGLQDFLQSGSAANLQRARQRAVFFSRLNPEYDQLRYLDEGGQEILRVRRGGEILPPDQLQTQATRAYFQKVRTLGAGQVYVSAFELALDNGQVKEPLTSVLRFALPVLDASGRRHGFYVINFLGHSLLGRLQQTASPNGDRLRVLNAQGYWLKAADPAEEWGFALPARAGFTLAKTDPNLWKRLLAEPSGQAVRAGGLFTWQRVEPREYTGAGAQQVIAEEPFLIVASEVRAPEFAALFAGVQQIFAFVAPALLIFAASSIWFFDARRRAREALRHSEENLKVTLHSIGDGVLATDKSGRVTLLNGVAERLTGWTLAEAAGRPIAEVFRIINEQTRQPAVIPVDRVLVTGQVQLLANHTLLIARDGTERGIADSAAPIHDRGGNILGVVLVFRDVTETRRAQEELDRFFTLSLDFLCISSADGYFKRVSPAVTDILGWSVEEFLAQPYVDLVHPDDRAATLREVERQVVSGEKVLQFENRYRHKDGSWRVLSWRSVPQPGGLMYATARDVTEVKRSEAEIRKLNRDLQLHASQVEAANRELESFSYSVSHDLRAPLRHVQGYVDLLSREVQGRLSEKGERYLETIAAAGRRMGVLIDDLLGFSRMSRSELHQTTINLDQLVAEVRASPDLVTTGRTINWKISPLPKVRGDLAMIRQVFANLLGNAVKYSRRRDVAEIEIGCAGEEGGRLIFFVRDNGAGFDMKYIDKLFGVFQRLHGASEFEGTGIGLANVQRIILRHGGRIWAEAKLEEGATFYFTLAPAGA